MSDERQDFATPESVHAAMRRASAAPQGAAPDTETERLRREVEDGRLAFFGAMQTAIATNSDLNAKAIGYAIKNEGLRAALDEAVQLVADALHGSLPQDEWNQRALVLIQEAAGAISGSQDTTTGDAT